MIGTSSRLAPRVPEAIDQRTVLHAVVRDTCAEMHRQIDTASDAGLPELAQRITRMTECQTAASAGANAKG